MSAPDARRLVLVVGAGRSGTSLLAGILGQLGLAIPQPEVNADHTNPRGFSEPRWVVDFHTMLLRERRVTVNDSRPGAWEIVARSADDAGTRQALHAWLEGQLREHPGLVVKDPRTVWFLPLWTRCAAALGTQPGFVTMLRHPAETLVSALRSYGEWQSPASRAAAWVNVSLETELATRGSARAFVRYDDLLGDWRREVVRIAELLDVPALRAIDDEASARVDAFVDPGLHRNRARWDGTGVPDRVRDLAEDVWTRLQPLADRGSDNAEAAAKLDAARDAFATFYSEAEAIAHSSIVAERTRTPRRPPTSTPKPPTLRARVVRCVPLRYRKRLRGALASLRGSRRS